MRLIAIPALIAGFSIAALALSGCGTTEATVAAGKGIIVGAKQDVEAGKRLLEGFGEALEPETTPVTTPVTTPAIPVKVYTPVPQTEK